MKKKTEEKQKRNPKVDSEAKNVQEPSEPPKVPGSPKFLGSAEFAEFSNSPEPYRSTFREPSAGTESTSKFDDAQGQDDSQGHDDSQRQHDSHKQHNSQGQDDSQAQDESQEQDKSSSSRSCSSEEQQAPPSAGMAQTSQLSIPSVLARHDGPQPVGGTLIGVGGTMGTGFQHLKDSVATSTKTRLRAQQDRVRLSQETPPKYHCRLLLLRLPTFRHQLL